MAKGKKYYTVWKGKTPGVYSTWEECKMQVEGFDGAMYKSFPTMTEAEYAFTQKPEKILYANANKATKSAASSSIIKDSIAVDGAWNTATLDAEYQGVYTRTGKRLFGMGPFAEGTNNIVEFLAIVHALGYCQKHQLNVPIYSDSVTAMKWVKTKKANTKVIATATNEPIRQLIDRAENWLQTNNYTNPILKWETESWGENPADFGRK